jgi:hypothetical protein
MSNTMKIDAALANLEAGKFSFRMVDAIKDHISSLENELEVVRGLHDSAIGDLKLQEIANWRLESELTKLNAKIYALLKANILTEKAYGGMTFVGMKTGEYVEISRKFAGATLERAMADLKSGKVKAQFVDASAKIYALLKKALREMTPYAHKMGEYLDVSRKFAGATLERAMADLKSGTLKSQFVDANAKIYALLKEALREMTPYAKKTGEYLEVFKRYVGASLEKASAYLATLRKSAA